MDDKKTYTETTNLIKNQTLPSDKDDTAAISYVPLLGFITLGKKHPLRSRYVCTQILGKNIALKI
jgi:hypothetical protein